MTPLIIALLFASAGPDALFKEGQALYADLEYEKALKKFTEAATQEPAGPESARIHLWKGLCESGLGKADEASASFRLALENNFDIELPGHASPKVKEEFAKIKSEVEAEMKAREAQEAATRNQVEAPSVSSDDTASVEHREGGGLGAMGILGIGLISVGAGGLIAGGVFNGLALQSLDYANDPIRFQNEALEAQDTANSQMLIATIAYAAGGVLVAAGGGMMFVGGSGE
jgi:tetratricopeptide (TPR) repeat protein